MRFVREYVFSPVFLRLNSARFNRGRWRSIVAWAIATMLAYLVVAAWHAPTIEIMIYGGLAGVGVVATQMPSLLPRSKFIAALPAALKTIGAGIGRMLLVLGMTLFASIFRADSQTALINLLNGLTDLSSISLNAYLKPCFPETLRSQFAWDGFLIAHDGAGFWPLLTMLFASLIVFFCPNSMQIFEFTVNRGNTRLRPRWRPNWQWAMLMGLLLTAWITLSSNGVTDSHFVYERF